MLSLLIWILYIGNDEIGRNRWRMEKLMMDDIAECEQYLLILGYIQCIKSLQNDIQILIAFRIRIFPELNTM